jgi:hypothetical protein
MRFDWEAYITSLLKNMIITCITTFITYRHRETINALNVSRGQTFKRLIIKIRQFLNFYLQLISIT